MPGDPGDMVVSDEDGVIIVSAFHVAKVRQKIVEWSWTETQSRDAIRNGSTLLTALERTRNAAEISYPTTGYVLDWISAISS
jgi:regulator of RNase E activity RraA